MTFETTLNLVVVVFTVSNLMAGGLNCDLRSALTALRSPRLILPTLLWGWVVGPALAWLIAAGLRLAPGHAAGLMMLSLAPMAPFLPIACARARGDMTFCAAIILFGTVVTVALMPLMAPLLVQGVSVSAVALARPLLLLVLGPLLIGLVIRSKWPASARSLIPWVRRVGNLFLLICLVLVLWRHGGDMLGTFGSLATLAWVLFVSAMAFLPWVVGFGLPPNRRSVMALAMSTRNIAAGFVAFLGITEPPQGMFVMVALVVPVAAIFGLLITPPILVRLAGAAPLENRVPSENLTP